MKLDEAIETLTSIKKVCEGLFPPDEQTAVSLGIEALKDIRYLRTTVYTCRPATLPGETEDYCKFCGTAHAGLECPDRGGEK